MSMKSFERKRRKEKNSNDEQWKNNRHAIPDNEITRYKMMVLTVHYEKNMSNPKKITGEYRKKRGGRKMMIIISFL
jgi:hypothetical protein